MNDFFAAWFANRTRARRVDHQHAAIETVERTVRIGAIEFRRLQAVGELHRALEMRRQRIVELDLLRPECVLAGNDELEAPLILDEKRRPHHR